MQPLSFRHWAGDAFLSPSLQTVQPGVVVPPILLQPLIPQPRHLALQSQDQAPIDYASCHSDLGPAPTMDAPLMGATQETHCRGARHALTVMVSTLVGVATGVSVPVTVRLPIPHNQEVRKLAMVINIFIIKLSLLHTVLFPEQ